MIVTYMATARGQGDRIRVLNPNTGRWHRFAQGVPQDLEPDDIDAMRLRARGGFDFVVPDPLPEPPINDDDLVDFFAGAAAEDDDNQPDDLNNDKE